MKSMNVQKGLFLLFVFLLILLAINRSFSQVVAPSQTGVIQNGSGPVPNLANPQSVFVSGNYAYVASKGSNALEIIDITLPGIPVHKGSLTNGTGGALLNQPQSVYVSGNYAYVTSSNALEILDVSNPISPVHKASFATVPNGALFVLGNYAYVSDNNGLDIIDISNPALPSLAGTYKNPANSGYFPYAIYVATSGSDTYACV